jgi:hypothetical protein
MMQTTITTQIQRAADAIRGRQLPNGAILMDPTSVSPNWLMPYYANLACLGWVQASKALGTTTYRAWIRAWLDWYAAHMNPDGTMYDYTYADGQLTSRNTYDSSDSYAATFLECVERFRRDAGGTSALRALYPAVNKAVGAILLTYQPDGLTWARPDYQVKYLMDNVEVYLGLRAAAQSARVMRDPKWSLWEKMASQTRGAIETALWLDSQQYYAWALHPNGARETRLSEWYPDIMAQLMAIAWLPPTERHRTLYARLKAQFYALPPNLSTNLEVEQAVWWGMAARAVDDTPTLSEIIDRLLRLDLRRRQLYPVSLYGHLIRVLSGL